jgi:DNA-binding transcriptional ArsR family regulator
MSNNTIFRALSSSMRIKILNILIHKEMHISGLARTLGISVPVTSRHIKKLEEVGLINKRIIGNVHLLSINFNNLENTFEPFIDKSSIDVDKKRTIFDALKQIPGINIKKIGNNYYIKSIDRDEGYYIYEVDGKLPSKPIDEYVIDKNLTLDIKKLISINKKKIEVNVKKK